MKFSRLGVAVVSVFLIFACAAAVIGSPYEVWERVPLLKRAAAASASVRVNGSQPRIPPGLRLSGDVIELAQGASVTVTATVGATTFPATVQGSSYSVNIGRPAAGQMVTVEARSPHVHYRSVVGSTERLWALAGGDAHLTRAENPSLRISPYSTALGWLVRYSLGGRDASSDAEFEKMTRVAASSDLEYAAYALAAIAKGELPLAAPFNGYADGYELIQDRDAFSQFIAYNNFRAASAGYLFRQAQETPLTASEALPNQLVLVDGMPRDQLPIGVGNVFLLGRRSDGKFDLNERLPTLDPINALALDPQGRIQLTPIGLQVRVVQKPDERNQYWWFDRAAAGRTLKRLTRGNSTSIWVMRSVWNDHDQRDPTASATQEVDYQVLSSTELSALSVTDGWSSLTGSTTTLPWMCAESASLEETVYDLSDCGYVEHRFEANGSGHTVDHGWKVNALTMSPTPARSVSFTWVRGVQGALDLTDGKVATSFWRVKDYPAEVAPVIFRSKALTGIWAGKTMVGINVAVTKNIVSWPQGAQVGDWQSGVQDWLPYWYSTISFSNFLQRTAGGAGQEKYATNGILPFAWQAVGDAAYDTRIRAFYQDQDGPPYVESCENAGASGIEDCYTRVRYFKPISRAGNRYYGIQDVYERHFYPEYPEESQDYRRSSELVYYDCVAGACASAATTGDPRGVHVRTGTGARAGVAVRLSRQSRARSGSIGRY